MFGKKPKPEQVAEQPAQQRGGMFTTHSDSLQGLSPLARLAIVQDQFITPTGGAGYAMDSADGLVPEFKAVGRLGGVPDAQLQWYAAQGFIGYQVSALLAQHWLVDKACAMPARDAVRTGYVVSLPEDVEDADKVVAEFAKQDKRYKINANMTEFIHFGRVFGVRVAVFRVESTDPEYYEKPFNLDGVTTGSYKGISQIDPLWIVPELEEGALSDPASINFYTPEFYQIGGKRYHRSHCVVYIPYPVVDSLKPSYQFGGKSLPQMIYERVYAAERTANEAPQLAMTKRTTVLKTDGVGFWANLTGSAKRLFDWTQMRDNYGALVIDKTDEDLSQHDVSLADFDAMTMSQYQLVAAIACVPSTKLLETAPKGFNATGEYEAESYRQSLESIQCNDLEPMLDRHHQLVFRSEIAPKLGLDKSIAIETSWHPLDSPTAAEWAEINSKKAATAKTLFDTGALDGDDIRAALRADKNSDFFGLEDPELDESDNEPDAENYPQA